MSYTIYYSDPSKVNFPIIVQDDVKYNSVGSGGLTLVGRSYPGYGQSLAENFVHLLENFASPVPPSNPIEGQLWYDSNTSKLRLNDGSATVARWKPVNGIFQQANEPDNAIAGDVWVDTNTQKLSIYNGNTNLFVPVSTGYSEDTDTGSSFETITDTLGSFHQVVVNKIDGTIISVVAGEDFNPNPQFDGFTNLRAGVNIANTRVFNGTAVRSNALIQNNIAINGNNFLRKDTSQGINGQFSILQDGSALKIGSDSSFIIERESEYKANFINTYPDDGQFNFKVTNNELQTTVLEINGATVSQGIKVRSTTAATSTLTGALQVVGGVGIGGNLFVGGWTVLKSTTTSAVNSFIGTPTGATVYFTNLTPKKIGVYSGTAWTDAIGNVLI